MVCLLRYHANGQYVQILKEKSVYDLKLLVFFLIVIPSVYKACVKKENFWF